MDTKRKAFDHTAFFKATLHLEIKLYCNFALVDYCFCVRDRNVFERDSQASNGFSCCRAIFYLFFYLIYCKNVKNDVSSQSPNFQVRIYGHNGHVPR